jgi:hypothetical protein
VRPDHAVLVTATGPGAAGVVADQRRLIPDGRRRSLFSSPCLAPQVDVWLAGANGRIGFHDDLVIANPGTTMANVTVSAWAVTGALQPPKLRSLTIGPLTTVTLPVGDYAPDAALVAWHVHANSGRVAAALHDVRIAGIRAAGSDWIPPTQAPARRLVVPGISPGPGARRLILTNPGPVDATVTLRLVTDSGNFSPAGHPTLVVRARHTVPVDLAPSLNGAAGAVVATSDNPVVGVVLTQVTTDIRRGRPDVQWQVAAPQLQGPAVLADNTPPFQRAVRIYLTAPEAGGRVRLTGRDGHSVVVTVPHGRTTFLDPRDKLGSDATGPILFERLSGGDIYLSRTLFAAGAHGPLTTAEQPTPLPTPVTLPAVADDVRAGLSPAAMTGP